VTGAGSQWIANIVLGVLVLTPLAAIVPASEQLVRERELAAVLGRMAQDGEFRNKTDVDARRKLQKAAKSMGFDLPTSEVIIAPSDPLTTTVVSPGVVGYTLPMRLPLFGFLDFEVIAARQVPVAP
jgi:hypothetical protein